MGLLPIPLSWQSQNQIRSKSEILMFECSKPRPRRFEFRYSVIRACFVLRASIFEFIADTRKLRIFIHRAPDSNRDAVIPTKTEVRSQKSEWNCYSYLKRGMLPDPLAIPIHWDEKLPLPHDDQLQQPYRVVIDVAEQVLAHAG